MPLTCQKCGKPTRTVFYQEQEPGKGEAWCKPCHQDRKFSGLGASTFVVPDAFPQSVTLENYGAQPVTFETRSQHKAYLESHDLNLKERWCPLPGTDRDPAGVQNPNGYIDIQTMKNKIELLLRANHVEEKPVEMRPFSGQLSHRDALAVATGTDSARQSRVHRRTEEQTRGK